jgi:hypothetical protein
MKIILRFHKKGKFIEFFRPLFVSAVWRSRRSTRLESHLPRKAAAAALQPRGMAVHVQYVKSHSSPRKQLHYAGDRNGKAGTKQQSLGEISLQDRVHQPAIQSDTRGGHQGCRPSYHGPG